MNCTLLPMCLSILAWEGTSSGWWPELAGSGPVSVISEKRAFKIDRPLAIHSISHVAITPDGGLLACSHTHIENNDFDYAITVWDVKNNTPKHVLRGHTRKPTHLAFSADGKTLISVCGALTLDRKAASKVAKWDMTDGKLVSVELLEGGGRNLTLSPHGDVLIAHTHSAEHAVKVWALDGMKKEPVVLEGHGGLIESAIVSRSGTRIATIGSQPDLIVWDFPTGKKLCECDLRRNGVRPFRNLALSPDGKSLVATATWEVLFLDVASGKTTIEEATVRYAVASRVSFLPDGQLIAYSHRGVQLWSPAKRIVVATLESGKNGLTGIPMFSEDGKIAISLCPERLFRLWELPKLDH
jgi:WD40 repeat protein